MMRQSDPRNGDRRRPASGPSSDWSELSHIVESDPMVRERAMHYLHHHSARYLAEAAGVPMNGSFGEREQREHTESDVESAGYRMAVLMAVSEDHAATATAVAAVAAADRHEPPSSRNSMDAMKSAQVAAAANFVGREDGHNRNSNFPNLHTGRPERMVSAPTLHENGRYDSRYAAKMAANRPSIGSRPPSSPELYPALDVVTTEQDEKHLVSKATAGKHQQPRQPYSYPVTATAAPFRISATNVRIAPDPSANSQLNAQQQRLQKDKKDQRKWASAVAVFAFIFVITSVCGVVVLRKSYSHSQVHGVSPGPTAAPTDEENASEDATPSVPPPTTPKFAEAVEKLSSISDRSTLLVEGTPQNQAMLWLLEEDEVARPISDPRFIQRYLMTLFYFAMDGDNWGRDCSRSSYACGAGRPYLSFSDECEWGPERASCTDDGLVHQIVMKGTPGMTLKGTLPYELAKLDSLKVFIVVGNEISGTIPPEYGGMSSLEVISLGHNQLVNPFPGTFRNRPNLKMLFIHGNNFSGTIPMEVTSIPNIEQISLAGNKFEGTIHSEFGSLSRLVKLDFDDNLLTGTLPTELGNLAQMDAINFDGNQLTGSIPEEYFSGWSKLRRLDFSRNKLSGSLSPQTSLWGRDIESTKSINLASNTFSGTLPPQLANITGLSVLRLENNDFVGTVPNTLCSLIDKSSYLGLKELTADCGGGEIECSCCSQCFGGDNKKKNTNVFMNRSGH